MNTFLLGGDAVACAASGLFFFDYWRSSRDRFFLFLTASFWIEAANRMAMAIAGTWSEAAEAMYLVRLLSYGPILVAIWDKNRPPTLTRRNARP
jgi:hypothetical protein